MTSTSAAKALAVFHHPFYIRHNQRRLEHLSTLGLDLRDKSVLEPGAGIGDHTLFYLDRGCRVTAVEPRSENCAAFRENVGGSWSPQRDNHRLIEADVFAIEDMGETFDIVHSYGLLYHLGDPGRAIAAMAARSRGLFLLETCVSMGRDIAINPVAEPADNPSQAADGQGCRPSRGWVLGELKRHMPHVYLPRTQPAHDEFPTDWTAASWPSTTGLTRAIFVASRKPLDNPALTTDLIDRQPAI
jgi:hypothetical protein